MNLPTVKLLSRDGIRARYRIEGGDLRADWAASLRPGCQAWCEITVYEDTWFVGGYGGEVWPSAWPELFHVGPRTIYGQTTTVTDAGRRLLLAAVPS